MPGLNWREILSVVGVFVFVMTAFILADMYAWAAFIGGVLLWLGVVELWAYQTLHKTLSQMFWEKKREHREVWAVLMLVLTLAMVLLLHHLSR
jgi:accessory gene regulator protein AgrB